MVFAREEPAADSDRNRPAGRPGKLSPARGSSARAPSCRVVDGASFGAPFEVSLWAMNLELTLVFRKVPEGYIGFVEELPGANSQGETLDGAIPGSAPD